MTRVGVIGGSSFVGERVISRLLAEGVQVTAFSREVRAAETGIEWRRLPETSDRSKVGAEDIAYWICVAPIWVLPAYFDWLLACGARRIVALSSTSRFTKEDSGDLAEQTVARSLTDGEARLQAWAHDNSVRWTILRPTLIYGLGRDRNVADIAHFIRRFGFFPLLGEGRGLRQPVHVDDVAGACVAALGRTVCEDKAYEISGAEVLAYRDMVARVFHATGRPARFVVVPLWVFSLFVRVARLLPRYRKLSVAMAERMNQDMAFSHEEATRDFGFSPVGFLESQERDSGSRI